MNEQGGPTFEHRPVMVDEIVAAFAPVPPGLLVDATLGGAGHAAALLDANPHLTLLGLDRDEVALAAAASTLARFGDRITLAHTRFDQLARTLEDLGHDHCSAVLFDLGVSSPQLDVAERGFSFRHDGPLDMRMDRSQRRTASDVVNGYPERDLAHVIRSYGDERFATRIARAIVGARPLTTTGQLADVVKEAIDFLAPGGRCAVLAYHSGEDRIVKERFRHHATAGLDLPPGLPMPDDVEPAVRLVRAVKKKPAPAEVAANPRAASARLRVVEKVAV
jgi:16S rRNA (cytosine1402-N4)-methyltransferase